MTDKPVRDVMLDTVLNQINTNDPPGATSRASPSRLPKYHSESRSPSSRLNPL